MFKCGIGMDPVEISKVIDGVYKNILENFNPASREIIATGKAYLKALHGASAASSLYLEAILKVSQQAEASSLGCSNDIGSSLQEVSQVFKEIHTEQLSCLKAFYVDFLVPLESNLERDTRVVQNEQKKFGLSHKRRMEAFARASASAKKIKKKGRKTTSSTAIDKEIRVMQELEEEKGKLELFCENSLNTALTEERRRYGFILERQASLAKHYLAFYSKGATLLNEDLDEWMTVSKSREVLPPSMQTKLISRIQKGSEDDCVYCTPKANSRENSKSLRKSKSMEGTEMLEIVEEEESRMGSIRAKSELSLILPGAQLSVKTTNAGQSPSPGPKPYKGTSPASGVVKGVYAYLSSGDNQLSFLEGDIITLIGDASKGWHFGQNRRTQKSGWFPLAYTDGSENFEPASHHRAIGAPVPPPPPLPVPTGLLLPYHPPLLGNGPIATTSTQTPVTSSSAARASDSPHSSNDSGFSNDIHKAVPPQPEIDYSEDEPQLSARDAMPYGDDSWLMEKYRKSESARMQHQALNPRRALSFVNISELTHAPEGTDRSRPLTRQPRTARHNSTSSQRETGPLKKFLTRTKSLLWKKDQSPPMSRSGTLTSPRREFDLVSNTGSCESYEPWASHKSVVHINSPSPPRRPPPSSPVKESGPRHCADPKPAKVSQQSQTDESRSEPPPLPPLPPPLGPWRSVQMVSPVTEESTENVFVSGKSKNGGGPSNNGSIRRCESEKVRNRLAGRKMLRVESFNASEAPIVPNPSRTHRTPRFCSRASIQSENVSEEDFLDDDQSTIFIEPADGEEDGYPPPPPPIREAEMGHKRSFENTKGSLRLLGRRLKSQSLRIMPNEPQYGGTMCETPDPKSKSFIDRNEGRRRSGGRRVKGSIRSEVHTLELIASESETGSQRGAVAFKLPLFEYGRQIQKRLYYPERTSKLDQKSERTGNLCGPWYDLWGIDPSVTHYSHAK